MATPLADAKAKAKVYLHCRQCMQERVTPNLDSFVDDDGKLYIWCRNHDREVFHTHEPVIDPTKINCEACRKGAEHVH